ncbi:hypothetical protein PR202_ga30437 [Eleusine coracana subsp. coracana]|uniref:Uncharacterized protein n=1 Tax=Eleusine coracana subsp. coracana TaxID=191504 RepID=A0AAV5DPR8_ELECO|nr:hypothetical protein PR202_ga30437 [Eleusine coracana subsp. coracana]
MGRQVQNVLCVREVSRILVRASDSSMEPHVLAVSNLDLVPQRIQGSLFCMYPKPPSTTTGGFDAVVDAFRSGLPSLLNHFFPLAGRLVTNPISGLPEVDCGNQGAELVVGEAASSALSSLDYGAIGPLTRAAQLPYAEDVALSVQVVSFACGGFTVAWCSHHVLMDGGALTLLVRAWSELARSGTLFRPRRPPSYGTWLHEWFTPLDPARQVDVLTLERSLVERLYRVDASVMARLRDAATGRATRAEAFSAYLWKVVARVVGVTLLASVGYQGQHLDSIRSEH